LAGIRYYLSQNNYKNISVIKYNEAEYRRK
jgi:hypothetical protein